MTSSVAIINWNSGERLRACVESLLAVTTTAEILIIDNASSDGSLESVQGFRNRVDVVRNSVNRGFAGAVNQAFQSTSSAYVLILNPDVRATPGAVQLLEEFLNTHPQAAAIGGNVGPKYLPKQIATVSTMVRENLGLEFWGQTPNSRSTGNSVSVPRIPQRVEQPAAAAIMIRRDAFEEVEGFDEQFYPAWYEDVDFCRRIKDKGWEMHFAPAAEFIHEGGYTADAMGPAEFLRFYYSNQLRYTRKHFGAVAAVLVRVSIAIGMLARMIGRPRQAGAYGKTFVGALTGW